MGTPEQERERLLKQVKEDNIEIASAERQSVDIYQFYYSRDVVNAVWRRGWVAGCRSQYCIKTTKPILKLFRPSDSPII